MAKQHKNIDIAAKHLEESVSLIPSRYKDGVSRADWEGPSTSEQSEINYRDGISDSISKDKRRVAIHAAGNAKFQRNAAEKGGAVIGERIRKAIPEYRAGFQPILAAINSAADAAPARTRDAMTNIDNRLKPVVAAAIAAKKR